MTYLEHFKGLLEGQRQVPHHGNGVINLYAQKEAVPKSVSLDL